jgi:hypothetical protein
MNSTFVVDKATHFCRFDCHDTAPLKMVISKVDFLESISAAIFASM